MSVKGIPKPKGGGAGILLLLNCTLTTILWMCLEISFPKNAGLFFSLKSTPFNICCGAPCQSAGGGLKTGLRSPFGGVLWGFVGFFLSKQKKKKLRNRMAGSHQEKGSRMKRSAARLRARRPPPRPRPRSDDSAGCGAWPRRGGRSACSSPGQRKPKKAKQTEQGQPPVCKAD